ncbi:CRISPR-associated endonuclease Cas1 [Candidatus Pacearchaeota archaeon]|nr:CRISPR-associated endonuclease Cas1 [Candidatus Pacearchaeota archaeon]QBM01519.1 CRISPR-associated endonuclease Cas1 [uncultured archaeon]
MKLIVNEFGAYLSKKENRFVIKTKEKEEEYSADQVDQIIISSPSSLSEGVVKLATEKNIDIVFTSFYGKPFARIYPCTLGGTTLTRREQAKAYFDERGIILVKEILKAKLKNQLFLIKRLSKTRNKIFSPEIQILEENLIKIDKINDKNIDSIRDILLGYEGYGASVYFQCLNKICPLKNRDPEGQDIFNMSLNYGYGILYSEVERACILSGLDPYLGFLHMDRYGKPSMVLDMVEQFRAVIDRAIITLFVQKRLSEEDIEIIGEGKLLTKEARTKIIEEVMKSFDWKVTYKNKKLPISGIVLEQGREVVRYLLGQSDKIDCFIWRD